MSETFDTPEQGHFVEAIADGLEHWLMKETGSSTTGRNHYLDDFDSFRTNLRMPYDDPRNTNAQKNRSHYSRLVQWTNHFGQYYDLLSAEHRDEVIANQIFCAQMYLSGLFRAQCMMQASDQNDYYYRRLDGNFIGIDLKTALRDKFDHSAAPPIYG